MSVKVLIVDDAAFMRMSINQMLTNSGYEVVGEAVNGKDAILKFKELQPDIITMDITMPDMDGIQAVRAIMAIDPNAKVLMISAMGQQTMVLDAMKAGAKNFIVKPFQKERLLEAFQNII
jgi:two-component system chemotaxis response regulator CheY